MILFLLLFGVFGLVFISAYVKSGEDSYSGHSSQTSKKHFSKKKAGTSVLGASLLDNSDVEVGQYEFTSSPDSKVTMINPATGLKMDGGIDDAGYHFGESSIDIGVSIDDFSSLDSSTSFDDHI